MSSAGSNPNQARVLIVDDDKINRVVASQLLKRVEIADIQIEQAESGRAALEMLRTESVDLVLMDIEMPGMSGLETTKLLRRGEGGESSRNIPVIAMTAHNTPEDEAACFNAGMNECLTKPLSLSRFSEILTKFLSTAVDQQP